MSGGDLLPWTQAAFDAFFITQDRQAHAYLLAGHSGLGKTVFAVQLAKTLLCQASDKKACGQCQSCRLFESGSHPDLHVLQSEKRTVDQADLVATYAPRYLEDESKRQKRKKPSAVITIDQVRDVVPDINTRPHLSNCRIIILNAAEDMNVNAANSLLKSLEEPPSDSFFLLISHDPGRLLPTLRSRCNRIDFRLPEKLQALAWLNSQLPGIPNAAELLGSAAGIPLRALALADGRGNSVDGLVISVMQQLAYRQIDPVTAASELIKKSELVDVLTAVQVLISRIIRMKFSPESAFLAKKVHDEALIEIGKSLNFKQLYAFLDKVSETKQLAEGPLDATLAIEDDLISWQSLFS